MSTITRTPRELIRKALLAIGGIGQNQDLENEQANDALDTLNEMLASWSTKSWMVPYFTREGFAGSGASSYAIGSGATWNTDRPLDIVGGYLLDSNSTKSILVPMTRDEWNDLAANSPSGRATKFYYYKSYANAVVNFNGIVGSGETAYLDLQKPLGEIATLDTVISLPPEYAELIKYQLAIRLAPDYERQVPEAVAALAKACLDGIISSNSEHEVAYLDTALQPGGYYGMRTING